MRLLLSNDDGIDAPGLQFLAARLQELGDVFVVAPAQEQSAKSHSLTMHRPLRVFEQGPQRWAVSGTPADCVYIALNHLLDAPPDVVVSGINNGSNLGSDVHYSGTVAAAREACLHGLKTVAVSLHRENPFGPHHWSTAAEVAVRVIRRLHEQGQAPRVLWNVNVPDIPTADLRGLRACRLGERVYHTMVDVRTDPRGKPYFWIGGTHNRFDGGADADGRAIEAGWATLTPLAADITAPAELERLREWTDG